MSAENDDPKPGSSDGEGQPSSEGETPVSSESFDFDWLHEAPAQKPEETAKPVAPEAHAYLEPGSEMFSQAEGHLLPGDEPVAPEAHAYLEPGSEMFSQAEGHLLPGDEVSATDRGAQAGTLGVGDLIGGEGEQPPPSPPRPQPSPTAPPPSPPPRQPNKAVRVIALAAIVVVAAVVPAYFVDQRNGQIAAVERKRAEAAEQERQAALDDARTQAALAKAAQPKIDAAEQAVKRADDEAKAKTELARLEQNKAAKAELARQKAEADEKVAEAAKTDAEADAKQKAALAAAEKKKAEDAEADAKQKAAHAAAEKQRADEAEAARKKAEATIAALKKAQPPGTAPGGTAPLDEAKFKQVIAQFKDPNTTDKAVADLVQWARETGDTEVFDKVVPAVGTHIKDVIAACEKAADATSDKKLKALYEELIAMLIDEQAKRVEKKTSDRSGRGRTLAIRRVSAPGTGLALARLDDPPDDELVKGKRAAIERLTRLINSDSVSAKLYFRRGRMCRELGDRFQERMNPKEAAAAYDESLRDFGQCVRMLRAQSLLTDPSGATVALVRDVAQEYPLAVEGRKAIPASEAPPVPPDVARLQAELAAAIKERDSALANLATAKNETRVTVAERDAARIEAKTAQTERDTAQKDLKIAQTERDTARTDLKTAQTERDQARAREGAALAARDAAQNGLKPYQDAEERWARFAASTAALVGFSERLPEQPARVGNQAQTEGWAQNLQSTLAARLAIGGNEPPRQVLDEAEAAYSAGLECFYRGDYPSAIQEFTRAIARNRIDARYYYFRGLARYLAAGGGSSAPADAVADLRLGASLEQQGHPASPEVSLALVRIQNGMRHWVESFRHPGRDQQPGTRGAWTASPAPANGPGPFSSWPPYCIDGPR